MAWRRSKREIERKRKGGSAEGARGIGEEEKKGARVDFSGGTSERGQIIQLRRLRKGSQHHAWPCMATSYLRPHPSSSPPLFLSFSLGAPSPAALYSVGFRGRVSSKTGAARVVSPSKLAPPFPSLLRHRFKSPRRHHIQHRLHRLRLRSRRLQLCLQSRRLRASFRRHQAATAGRVRRRREQRDTAARRGAPTVWISFEGSGDASRLHLLRRRCCREEVAVGAEARHGGRKELWRR